MCRFAGSREKLKGWCIIPSPHHGGNLIECLQVSHDLRLVSRLDTGEASRPFDGFSLAVQRQVVELAARVGLSRHFLVLSEDADSPADGHGCALVVPRDHDDTYARLVAQFNRTDDLLPGRVEHAHTADKCETQLNGNRERERNKDRRGLGCTGLYLETESALSSTEMEFTYFICIAAENIKQISFYGFREEEQSVKALRFQWVKTESLL